MKPRFVRQLKIAECAVVGFAFAFVVLSFLFPVYPRGRTPVVQPDGPTGFRAGGVYPSTLPPERSVVGFGSWIDGDAFTGDLRTAWSPVESKAYVLVAGYPNLPHMSLRVETRCEAAVTSQDVAPSDPGERWTPFTITFPPCSGVRQARLLAHDGSHSARGWLGVSAFLSRKDAFGEGALTQVLRLGGCTVLAIVLTLLPGLIFLRVASRVGNPAFIALPGLALLLIEGCGAWLLNLAASGSASNVCTFLTTIELAGALAFMIRVREPLLLAIPCKRLIAVAVCVVVIASGRALYFQGAGGELYGGSISRTFEPGDRSDSRISFHVVQLVANGSGPYSDLAHRMFDLWTFSDRGPIAGIAASPIVLLSGARPPETLPEQPWSPFDPEGFAAYRAAMFVFASTVLFALFGLVFCLAGPRAAQFAVAIAALAPFLIHETWFTWPKLFAASFTLIACTLLVRRSYILAGFSVGVAYLVHPSALFVMPALIAYAVIDARATLPNIVTALVRIVAGPIVVMAFWRFINGSHYTQTAFLNYVFANDGRGAGAGAWLADRIISLADTLVPFYLPFANATSPEINAIGSQSSVAAHLGFAYWATLPFGIGLFYLIPFASLTVLAARRSPKAFGALVAAPFVVFWVYWGAASSGLMREGLHWWFFILIAFVAVVAERNGALTVWPHSLWLRLRAIEVAAMALLPAMLDHGRIVSVEWARTDILAIGVIVAGCSVLAFTVLPRQTGTAP